MNTVYIKTYAAPQLSEKEILRYSGAKTATAEIDALISECISEAWDRITYKVCYIEVPIENDGDSIRLGTLRADSDDLKKNLSGCDSAVIFAATVGIALDRLIGRYSTVSSAKALMIQALGAERIESLCDEFNKEITIEANKSGKFTRPRFSPGYGDLPIGFQKDIFAVLDCSRKIGLSLNESLLMSPTKSVTAIIGITKSECEHKAGCEVCSKTDCTFRRKE